MREENELGEITRWFWAAGEYQPKAFTSARGVEPSAVACWLKRKHGTAKFRHDQISARQWRISRLS
jgi:hypothetical protein